MEKDIVVNFIVVVVEDLAYVWFSVRLVILAVQCKNNVIFRSST